jgi:hypothetical protein
MQFGVPARHSVIAITKSGGAEAELGTKLEKCISFIYSGSESESPLGKVSVARVIDE